MSTAGLITRRLWKGLRLLALSPSEARYRRQIRTSGMFDATFYRGAHPSLHALYRRLPLRHFIREGEAAGLRPNPDFSPEAYLRLNPDVARAALRPLQHFLTTGQAEGRTLSAPLAGRLPKITPPKQRFDPARAKAPVAVVAHIYYPELWASFAQRLSALEIEFDLYVTLTWRGRETAKLEQQIREEFPRVHVTCLPNQGRDILPFLTLLNAGAFEGYKAVAKIHTKKSPHRKDGDLWRDHLIEGILPLEGLEAQLATFLENPDAGLWVADGQHYRGAEWWGSNRAATEAILRRVELGADALSFPAGSIYWLKPMVLGMIRALRLGSQMFEPEQGQVDGTLAHAFERGLGRLVEASGQKIYESSALATPPSEPLPKPRYTSAFYLPQFHPTPQNDAWWGAGFTEWRAASQAVSMYPGHIQPLRPADLGYYDLRAPEVMAAQAKLARTAGVDGFCVYHYWFDPDRILETPLNNLLARPEIDFPFYLCWANESWRRNWDGLSGEVLMGQDYTQGFEERLVRSTLPYMRDARYQRPDGERPRFIIYRPGEMPEPAVSIARMRVAWREAGIGEVELGAVHFHQKERAEVAPDLMDFWVEMPPHGLVQGGDYLFGGPGGDRMGAAKPTPEFDGLIYDYGSVAKRALSRKYAAKLPANTIAGIMPSWDNTARRGARGHIAHGANPATFRVWLQGLRTARLSGSYRGELFVNAWNEWAEKAVLEPSDVFGRLYLEVLGEACAGEAMPDVVPPPAPEHPPEHPCQS